MKKRMNSKILEVFLAFLMAFFGVGAVTLMVYGLRNPHLVTIESIIIIFLIVLIITILWLSYLLVRIWEKHIVPYYVTGKEQKNKK